MADNNVTPEVENTAAQPAPAAAPAAASPAPASVSASKLLKILIPIGVAVVLIIGGLVGYVIHLVNDVIPAEKYDAANELINSGEYEDAIAILDELGDYNDSEELKESTEQQVKNIDLYAEAEKLLDDQNYQEAYDAFLDLGDYSDASEQAENIYNTYLSPIAQIRNANIGDIIYLTDDPTITWRVLARDMGKVLLYETFENRKPDHTYDVSDVKSDTYWTIDSFTTNYYFTDRELTKYFVKPGTFIPDADLFSAYIRNSDDFVSDGYPWVIRQGNRRRFEGSDKDYYHMRYIGIDNMLNGDKANGKFVFRVFVWIDVSED